MYWHCAIQWGHSKDHCGVDREVNIPQVCQNEQARMRLATYHDYMCIHTLLKGSLVPKVFKALSRFLIIIGCSTATISLFVIG